MGNWEGMKRNPHKEQSLTENIQDKVYEGSEWVRDLQWGPLL